MGLGEVFQIGIGQCLQWNIVMDDDIEGAGLGVSPKRKSECRKARKTNNAFYLSAVLNSSPRLPPLSYFACLSLLKGTYYAKITFIRCLNFSSRQVSHVCFPNCPSERTSWHSVRLMMLKLPLSLFSLVLSSWMIVNRNVVVKSCLSLLEFVELIITSGIYTFCDSMPCIMRPAMLLLLSRCALCLCNSWTYFYLLKKIKLKNYYLFVIQNYKCIMHSTIQWLTLKRSMFSVKITGLY